MALVKDLVSYEKDFSKKEIEQLESCFNQIQDFIKEKYISKGSHRREFEYEIHNNMYSCSYLVIDFNKGEVYLSRRNHGTIRDDYFCANEKAIEGFKYVMCSLVVTH